MLTKTSITDADIVPAIPMLAYAQMNNFVHIIFTGSIVQSAKRKAPAF